MFEELLKYTKGHFTFHLGERLNSVCNAPNDSGGVYLVYDITNENKELIYIGRCGQVRKDGSIWIREKGLKGRLVKGIHEFPEQEKRSARRKAWPTQMKIEDRQVLYIEWFITLNDQVQDCPDLLERNLRKKYQSIYGKLPKWNLI